MEKRRYSKLSILNPLFDAIDLKTDSVKKMVNSVVFYYCVFYLFN